MFWAGQILLTIGTLIVVVPARDAVVIVADSKTTRRMSGGQGIGATATEKVFGLPGVPGTAFFVTGISPVEFVHDGGGVATVVAARGLVTARLARAGRITREAFDAVAAESVRLSARVHRMGAPAAPLVGRELFTVVMVRAGSGAAPHEVASFVVRLTSNGAEVSRREWQTFVRDDHARVLMFGEGAFVGAGLSRWSGGTAECARRFMASGTRAVRAVDPADAARGAYSILEATSTAMGADGTVGPPFRAYLLARELTEMPPVAPCR
jgi:hypothetical protein